MPSRPWMPLAVAALAFAAAVPVQAQTADPAAPLLGRTVTSVDIEVEGRTEAPAELAALVVVRPGAPLRREDWRTTLSRFAARFEQVSVLAVPEAGGVRIVFRLEPRHPIDRVEFAGDTGVPARELQQLLLARYGGVPTGVRLDEVEATVRSLLADQGYINARVTASTIETHNPDRATLHFDVNAGAPARIASVSVAGTSPLDEQAIVARAGARVGEPFRDREIQRRMAELEESLRGDGYYEANARSAATRRDDGGMDVTLVVDAGPLIVRRFEGDPLPAPAEELVPIERSRSADNDLLEDSRRRIEARLRADGYRDAQAPFARLEDAGAGTVVITYTVTRGPRYRVDGIVLPDGLSLPESVVLEALGLEPGDAFSQAAYDAGMQRVIFEYQQRGFYRASGQTNSELLPDGDGADRRVVLHPGVTEGPQATVDAVRFEFAGASELPESDLLAVMRLLPGRPYVPAAGLADVRDLGRLYRDRGFLAPIVNITPELSEDGRRATLVVNVSTGPQLLVGDIIVVGNEQISAASVRETLTFREGEPFGEAAAIESRRRLLDLGIFRTVSIAPQDLLAGETLASVVVRVEELPATTVGFGGGVEVGRRPRATTSDGRTDILEVSPRGFFEIGRRNLGGRNRAVNLFARVALKPEELEPGEILPDQGAISRYGFTEYRVTGSFREQRAFRTDTDVTISLTSEQGVRTLFDFSRQQASAQALRRLSRRVTLFGRYALDFSELFRVRLDEEDRLAIDRLFAQVRISSLSAGVLWDRRDDAVAPSRGTLVTADLEVAARGLGSQVGFAKTFVQAAGFRPIASEGRAVFAGRVQLGVARGLARVVPLEDDDGNPILGPDGQPLTETVEDLPASQRYFAGGGTTVRGFQIDRLGVPEIINDNGLSNGGNAVVILNAELRTVAGRLFGRELGLVGFADAGNVFAKASDLDLARLRTALGFGVRYDSPIGPLRLDFGFKTSRRIIGGLRERGWEYHFSIGEAF